MVRNVPVTRRCLIIAIPFLMCVWGCPQGPQPPVGAGEPVERIVSALVTGVNVTTSKNNNSRTAANTVETVLTPQNVKPGSFGRLYARTVHGNILTQPLYVGGVTIGGVAKDVVFVATNENDIYAFDADNTALGPANGLLWHANLGIATPNALDFCSEAPWKTGILGTPVIDVANNVMFVAARIQVACDATHNKCDIDGAPACNSGCLPSTYFLKKLNLSTGATLATVEITGAANGVTFDPFWHQNRPGLLLMNGFVYIGFGTRACDRQPYQGWVFGYRGSDLVRVAVYNNGSNMAGIWQSGHGLAGDNSNVYLFSANTENDTNLRNFMGNNIGHSLNPNSNSIIRVAAAGNGSLTFGAKYTPANNDALNAGDTDLGSGGPVLLPGGSSGMLIGGGKEGQFYLLDRSLVLQTAFQASWQSWHPPSLATTVPCYFDPPMPFSGPMYPDTNNQIFTQSMPDGPPVANCGIRKTDYQWGQDPSPNIHGGPAFWQSTSTRGFVYLAAEKDYLKAFTYDIPSRSIVCGAGSPAGECNPTMTSTTLRSPDGMPGGAVSVSSNGMTNGIVWSLQVKVDGVLLAPDGTSLSLTNFNYQRHGQDYGKKVYGRLAASDAATLQELWRDESDVPYTKFMPVTVAGGLVFRPSVSATNLLNNPQSELVVYGPLSRGSFAQTTGPARRLLLQD